MAIRRRVNLLSQQRVDVPDLRSVESAASNDFDELIKAFVTGTQRGYVLRGFEISMAGAIGGASNGLQLLVESGAVFHINSSQSGTFLLVPEGTDPERLDSATNTIVDGAFTPSAINYVGLEYERFLDDATTAQVYLWNPTTKDETTVNAPRASVLRYRIKISTTAFPSNVLPLAIVTTDLGNNVFSVTDIRHMLFRLGQGGTSADPFYSYPWSSHSEGRTENPSTSTSESISPFRGGDKMLGSFKDWADALMTSIKEIKGTAYWYSTGTAGSLESLRQDLGNTVVTGRGKISHSDTTAGQINWEDDINLRIIGSDLKYTIKENLNSSHIILDEDEAAYVSLIRNIDVTPNLIFVNSSVFVESVGSVSWTTGLEPGDWVKISSDPDSKYYEIDSVINGYSVNLVDPFAGTSTGPSGAKAKYSYGYYETSASPSTDRHIRVANRKEVPSGDNVFWLFLRSDNGGSIPRVYIRFMGSELQQGEDRQISDNQTLEVLQYIGSPLESATEPQYVSALNPGSVKEIREITVGDASTISSNEYFLISSSSDARLYYVWFNKDGSGVDPEVPGADAGLEVNILTGDTDEDVANALSAVLNGTFFEDFYAYPGITPDIVIVENTSAGECADAVNFDVGAPFSITTTQQGTGLGNHVIVDGDNLTLAIKKLDRSLASLLIALDDPSYEEFVDIVASGEIPPDSLDGPISSGTLIQLPLHSRISNIPYEYTVGQGRLEVRLNGVFLRLGDDWNEVGVPESTSDQIEILLDLEAGDVLSFRASVGGGGGGAGGGVGPQGPPGPAGPTGADGADAIGGPVAISTKNSNYTVTTSDNVLLADCSGGPVTFTLPPAASATGQVFFFKKIDSSSNAMNIQGDGSELIDDLNTQSTMTQWESFTMVTNGTQYYII